MKILDDLKRKLENTYPTVDQTWLTVAMPLVCLECGFHVKLYMGFQFFRHYLCRVLEIPVTHEHAGYPGADPGFHEGRCAKHNSESLKQRVWGPQLPRSCRVLFIF